MKLIITFLFSCLIVHEPRAQTDHRYQDGEALARAFLEHVTTCYAGSVSALKYSGNSWIEMHMQFVMDMSLQLTNLSIDNESVQIRKPLLGIPVPEEGYRNFKLTVSGLDSASTVASSGTFSVTELHKGDLIAVTVIPRFPPIFIPSTNDSQSVQLIITGTDDWAATYDPVRRGYLVYILDSSTDVQYEIATWDGLILSRGHLPAFDEVRSPNDPVLNIRLAGNVVDARLSDRGYSNLPNQCFDGTVIRDELAVPAKVFIVPDISDSYLYIWITGIRGAILQVRGIDGSAVPMSTKDYGAGVEMVSMGKFDKAMVTVLPGPESNIDKPFSIYFGRQH